MTEQKPTQDPNQPVQKSQMDKLFNIILVLIIVAGILYLVMQRPAMTGKILLVMLGFGAVVMIHELGHFLMAKFCGIKVEMFSIGFPPILVGIRKTRKGFRFRLLPQSGSTDILEEGDSDTEYCIGALPFGGFVKMLGQSDSGPVEKTDDPRSFLNKPIWQRIVVVAGGVAFNAIGAMILFMALFMHGLQLMPAVVATLFPVPRPMWPDSRQETGLSKLMMKSSLILQPLSFLRPCRTRTVASKSRLIGPAVLNLRPGLSRPRWLTIPPAFELLELVSRRL
jgi:membrane-associated protease RseP (regulator of RpoE activity)